MKPLAFAFYAVQFFVFFAETGQAQIVVFTTRTDAAIGDFEFTNGDFIQHNLQTGESSIYLPETTFAPWAGSTDPDVNPDALHIRDDGTFLFSSRGSLEIDGERIDQRELTDFNPVTRTTNVLFAEGGVDISGLVELDNGNYLIAAKVNNTIGDVGGGLGLDYRIGDVVELNVETGVATTFFSADNFLSAEDGGSSALANIDALELLNNGNLLFSTTNEARLGTDFESSVFIEQENVYEYNFDTAETTLFFDGSALFNENEDIKSFSILSSVATVPEPSSALIVTLGLMLIGSRRSRRQA